MAGLTIDAGALIAADRNERAAWSAKARALSNGTTPVIPTPALMQAWRGGRNANLARFLRGCLVEPLDEQLARLAGELLGRSGTADAIDAAVIVSAARRGDVVLTSDPGDLERLAEFVPSVRILGL